jgi:HlyD family secretion protein
MPSPNNEFDISRHSDDIQEVLLAIPGWALRFGTYVFFAALMGVLAMASIIKYPEVILAQLKIVSQNAPKPIVSKISGKLSLLLVKENETVFRNQPLAYIESTAKPEKVFALSKDLSILQQLVIKDEFVNDQLVGFSEKNQYGELQTDYQIFYQEYLLFKTTTDRGILTKRKKFLHKDLNYLRLQQQELTEQQSINKKNYSLANEDYQMHKLLEQKKVETKSELREQESKFLLKKAPLVQTESAILTADNSYLLKQRELLELEDQIKQEKLRFLLSINKLISSIADWETKYIIIAPQEGKVTFVGVIQENVQVAQSQELFYVEPENERFLGQLAINQNSLGKVQQGQEVLIKMRSYPFEQFGMIRGKIGYISDVPYKDSTFIATVTINNNRSDQGKTLRLKHGMLADGEVITQNATLLQRFSRNVLKILNESKK